MKMVWMQIFPIQLVINMSRYQMYSEAEKICTCYILVLAHISLFQETEKQNWEWKEKKMTEKVLTVTSDESFITSLAKLSLLAHTRQFLHFVFSTCKSL